MRKDQSEMETLIRVELVKRKMSIADLANAIGMSRGYIYDFLHGARKGDKGLKGDKSLKSKIYEYLGITDEH